MITINGNKISANQTVQPNDSTDTLDGKDIRIMVPMGSKYKSSTHSYTITDHYIDEIAFNVNISQWDTVSGSTTIQKTFSWTNLQTGAVLHSGNGWKLSVTCRLEYPILKFIYQASGDDVSIAGSPFEFRSTPTIRGAQMVDDLVFQDGAMKISSIIDYQEKRQVFSDYTVPYPCIAMTKYRHGSSSGTSSWYYTFSMYKKGDIITVASNEEKYLYIYLIFKNPED